MKKRRGRRRNSDLSIQPSNSASTNSGTSAGGMDARAAVAAGRTGITTGGGSTGRGGAGNVGNTGGVLNDFVEPMRGDQMSSPENPDLSPGFDPDAGVHLDGGGMLDDKRFILTSPLHLDSVAASCFDPLAEAGLPLPDMNRGASISVPKSEFV